MCLEGQLLCYLSGLTRDEAAEQLGWSISTLKRRLEEGRTALRRRLERRGISAAGLALAVLSPSALDAAVCPALAKSCLDAVLGKEVGVGVSPLILTTTTTIRGIAMKAVIVSLALVGLAVGIYPSFGRDDGHFSAVDARRRMVRPRGGIVPLLKGCASRGTGTAHLTGTCDVWTVCFSPDGKRIVTAGGVVTLPEGQQPGRGEGVGRGEGDRDSRPQRKPPECAASASAPTANGSPALLGPTVRAWDAEKGQELLTIKGQTRSISSLCFSPDGKLIASVEAGKHGQGVGRGEGTGTPHPKGSSGRASASASAPTANASPPVAMEFETPCSCGTRRSKCGTRRKAGTLTLKLPVPGPASVCFSLDL